MVAIKADTLTVLLDLQQARGMVNREPNEALRKLDGLIKRLGETPLLLNMRGTAYYQLGKYKESFQDFKGAEKSDPKNREYIFNVAVALREMCDFQGAKFQLDRYVKEQSDDVWGHYNRGVVHHYLRDYETALAEYNVVVATNEQLVEAALFNSAAAFSRKFEKESNERTREKHLERAIDYLDKSVKLGGKVRIGKIRESLVPIDQRPPKCEGYYETQDLSGLMDSGKFKDWLAGKSGS
jgi:tetratricopeptide (TPR) repeat protein